MAQVAARCGNRVRIYARNAEVVQTINSHHINPHYLPEFELSELISATTSVEEALKDAHFVILALPTQLVRKGEMSVINSYSFPLDSKLVTSA